MQTLFILIFLISLILLPIGLIKPSLLKLITRKVLTRKQIALIFGGLLIGSIVLGVITSPAPKGDNEVRPQVNDALETKADINEATQVEYEVVSYENNKLVENYWLLIADQQKSKANLEAFARNFKKEKCKKDCNISLYDDKKAADLDMEYTKIIDMVEANTWKEKNYVYVADHLIGYLIFDGDLYMEYPYRDSYYDELKTQ